MAFFSDSDIERILSSSSRTDFQESNQNGNWNESGTRLLIFPFKDEFLTPVGYDLTIGDRYLSFAKREKSKLQVGETFAIQPGETVLITTEEYLGMPKDRSIAGLIESKVSIVSKGLSHISTTLDNDWEGHLLVGVTNLQSYPIALRRGQPFCSAIFVRSETPATRSCGKPAGRLDIVEDRLDEWLKEAKRAEPPLLQQLLPTLIPLTIVLLFGAAGLLIFGPTEGFSGTVAIGAAIAAGLLPAIQLILKRTFKRL